MVEGVMNSEVGMRNADEFGSWNEEEFGIRNAEDTKWRRA